MILCSQLAVLQRAGVDVGCKRILIYALSLFLSLSLSLQATGHLEGKYKHLTYKGHLTADDTVTELPSTHSAACDHGSKAHHGLKVNICVCFPKHVRTSTRISSHLSQQNSTSEVTGYLHKTDCIINSYFNLQYYFTQYYCSYCILIK